MAHINITLDQDEILALLDAGTTHGDGDSDDGGAGRGAARADVFRRILESTLNGVLRAESAAQLHAAPYERTGERTDSRNGLRRRSLATRLGVLGLDVPRHRSEPFQTRLFDNYSRSEAALVTTMAEMVVMGVSTRKVTRVVEELCGRDVSKSVVSEACKSLDKEVETFRGRPIEGAYPFLAVDATYLKVRVDHRIVSRPLMVAYGTDGRGRREVLALELGEREDEAAWTGFLRGLAARGMACPLMVTSDANEGIRKAVGAVFPGAAWQRCQFHFSKNIADKAPRKYQAGIRQELTEMSDCKTLEEARQRKDRIVADYRDVADQAATCLDEGFESAMSVMQLPAGLRPYMRTNNHLERLNREIKRRTRVIGVFPNTDAAVRMAGSVLIEQNRLAQARKAIFSEETYRKLMQSDTVAKLRDIAREQAMLRAA
jgi:transposase-like protein